MDGNLTSLSIESCLCLDVKERERLQESAGAWSPNEADINQEGRVLVKKGGHWCVVSWEM